MYKSVLSSKNKIYVLLISTVGFVCVSLPFTYLTDFFVVSEVRPAAVLNTCFGFVFGPVGALGCAVGNSVVDAITVDIKTAVLGFPQQFIYGLIPWIFLRLSKHTEDEKNFFRFKSSANANYFLMTLGMASAFVAASVALFFGTAGARWSMFRFIFTNNITMTCIFGMPLALLLFRWKKEMSGFGAVDDRSINETLIVFIMAVECVSLPLIGLGTYFLVKDKVDGVDLWNSIFGSTVIAALVFTLVLILFMQVVEKRILVPLSSLSKVWQKDRSLAIEMCNSLYEDRSEIGELSRDFLALADEIQRSIIASKTEEVPSESGIGSLNISDGVASFSLVGSLDENYVPDFEELLNDLPESVTILEIDAKNTVFMTSKFLQVLYGFTLARPQVKVSVKNASDSIRLIFNITGFTGFIED